MFLNDENRLRRRLISGCKNPKYLEIKFMFFLTLLRSPGLFVLTALLSFFLEELLYSFERIEQNFIRLLKPTYLRKTLIQNYIIRR